MKKYKVIVCLIGFLGCVQILPAMRGNKVNLNSQLYTQPLVFKKMPLQYPVSIENKAQLTGGKINDFGAIVKEALNLPEISSVQFQSQNAPESSGVNSSMQAASQQSETLQGKETNSDKKGFVSTLLHNFNPTTWGIAKDPKDQNIAQDHSNKLPQQSMSSGRVDVSSSVKSIEIEEQPTPQTMQSALTSPEIPSAKFQSQSRPESSSLNLSIEQAPQQLGAPQGFSIKSGVNYFNPVLSKSNSKQKQKAAAAPEKKVAPIVSKPLLLTYDPTFKNLEPIPAKELMTASRDTATSNIFKKPLSINIPNYTRMQERPIAIEKPVSAPLLLTYDATIKNPVYDHVQNSIPMSLPMLENSEIVHIKKALPEELVDNQKINNVESAQVQESISSLPEQINKPVSLSSNTVYDALLREPYSMSKIEQSPALNESFRKHYTGTKSLGRFSQPISDAYAPQSKQSTNLWQGQANRPRKNTALTVDRVDRQMQETSEQIQRPLDTANVAILDRVEPTATKNSTTELMSIIEMQTENEHQALPKNPTLQVIFDMLTRIKNFILDMIGYKPSPQAAQVINNSLNKAAHEIDVNRNSDSTINSSVVAAATGSLAQDFMVLQLQDTNNQNALQNSGSENRITI